MTQPLGVSRYTAFCGHRLFLTGSLREVACAIKSAIDRAAKDTFYVFDDASGKDIEIDLRGTLRDVLERLPEPVVEATSEGGSRSGPGRPRLGVVAREVTLLPRHWEWLSQQSGGASVTLRRLVDEARKANAAQDATRGAVDAAYRFMLLMGGDLPGFEAASRALYGGEIAQAVECLQAWPEDVRAYACVLLQRACPGA